MLKNLNLKTKFYIIKSNNPILQGVDNKVNELNNNFSINSNDFNIDNKSSFDNLILNNNETSTLHYPNINLQSNEKITKPNLNEEKIKSNKLFIKSEKNQLFVIERKKESSENNYESIKSKKLKSNILNRKRKNNNSKESHSKYADDNLGRKIKNLILNYTLKFLNEKIKIIYNEIIGSGIFKKELLPLHQSIKANMTVEYNTNLLHKTLGEIFMNNISTRYTNYFKNHNKIIINILLNDKNEKNAAYFRKLFNII
jgi:hypothetical protein